MSLPGSGARFAMTLAEARVWARVGVLAALALVLSYVETFIPLPVPVPGIKLGLANIVVLMALVLLDVKSAALVALVKVLAAGFLFGNPVMMLYSAGGTVLAFAAMAALSRIRGLSVVLVAVVGAILHNLGQLAVASVILGTPLVWASAPVLVIAACATGALSGMATRYAIASLGSEAEGLRAGGPPLGGAGEEGAGRVRAEGYASPGPDGESCAKGQSGRETGGGGDAPNARFVPSGAAEQGVAEQGARRGLDARAKLACLVVYVVVALHVHTLAAVALCLAAACACAAAVRLPARMAIGVLRPLAPILVITVVMQVLYYQQGDALIQIGPLAVTVRALAEAARMVAVLLCVMLASVSFMKSTTSEELVATLRWLLKPLRALGLRTDAFMLSLSLAFRFVPVLVADFQQLVRAQRSRGASFEGGVRARLSAYMRLFAPLTRSSFRRADTLAEACVSRSFGNGTSATTLRAAAFAPKDAAACLATLALAAACLLV